MLQISARLQKGLGRVHSTDMVEQYSSNFFRRLDRRSCLRTLSAGAIAAPALAHGEEEKKTSSIKAISIALNDDRLWTTLQIKQSPEMIAIFDSGSHSDVIASGLVTEHKLRHIGRGGMVGIGGEVESSMFVIEDVMFGRTLKLDSTWAQSSGLLNSTPFKYLIGCQSLTFRNSELDLVRMQWRKAATALELIQYANSLDDKGPYQPVEGSYRNLNWTREVQLRGTVDGFSGRFLVDTGSPTNLVMGGKATKALGLWTSDQPYAPWRIQGFGRKRLQSRLYRLNRMSLSGIELERPLILLSNPGTIESTIEGYDGLIGMRALRSCNMLFDQDQQKLWLRPNRGPALPDLNYPMSGIWVERSGGRITVEEVSPQSPAALAGVVPGDSIVAADWKQLLQTLNSKAGTAVRLDIERNAKRRSVEFGLHPYL